MKRCLIAILLFSLMLLLCACMLIPMHTEIPSHTAAETAKPAAPTPTPAPAYEVTMQRATTWVIGTGSRWVQVIAAIENTGSASLCLSGGAYDLEDAPGETGYLYETTLLDEPVEGELTLLARPDAKRPGSISSALQPRASTLPWINTATSGSRAACRTPRTRPIFRPRSSPCSSTRTGTCWAWINHT